MMYHESMDTTRGSTCPPVVDPFPTIQLARVCRAAIAARARRRQFFKASLFSDPAWDILLRLFTADGEGRKLSISAVGFIAKIPNTTTLRWINILEREGLVERENDSLDARRTFVSLSEKGLFAMRDYFQDD